MPDNNTLFGRKTLDMDDGEGINFNDLNKQKQEKDLKELQNLNNFWKKKQVKNQLFEIHLICIFLFNAHFQERESDQTNFEEFKAKIDERKAKRAGEIETKKQKEAEKAK